MDDGMQGSESLPSVPSASVQGLVHRPKGRTDVGHARTTHNEKGSATRGVMLPFAWSAAGSAAHEVSIGSAYR